MNQYNKYFNFDGFIEGKLYNFLELFYKRIYNREDLSFMQNIKMKIY